MAEVDLGRLASGYGHRSADPGNAVRAETAFAAAGCRPGDRVVDIGGGTGRHSAVFAGLAARPIVVDVSPDMAAAAAAAGLSAVVGDGHALPLADAIARLSYFHLSIHHGDHERMLEEAVRVVGPGGAVWVWTLADDHPQTSFLTRWFPGVAAIDGDRFPPVREIAGALESLGMVPMPTVRRTEVAVRSAGSWIAAVRAGFVSTLHLLPDREVEAGLDAFRREYPDPDAQISYELPFVGVAATRPSLRS